MILFLTCVTVGLVFAGGATILRTSARLVETQRDLDFEMSIGITGPSATAAAQPQVLMAGGWVDVDLHGRAGSRLTLCSGRWVTSPQDFAERYDNGTAGLLYGADADRHLVTAGRSAGACRADA